MAGSWTTSHPQILKFENSRGKTCIFARGVYLSIREIEEIVNGNVTALSDSQLAMKNRLLSAVLMISSICVSLPVRSLQHVTGRSALRGIIKLEGFISLRDERELRRGFKDLSFWSAQISGKDIEDGRQQAIDKVRRVISPEDAQKYQHEIQKQFATSPAFISASRYGQYKFSFPLSDLLSWYGDQFCQGGEPQLRILGTEFYRLEIAHYIVVHGPDTDLYNDLPMVPTGQSEEDSLGFVYWMDDTLYWRPESTSNLYVKILKDGSVHKECYMNCPYLEDGIYAPWNHLGIAFHIPPEHHLKISRQDLLKNVTTCEKAKIYLGKESDDNPSKVLNSIREEFTGQCDK